MKLDKLHIAQFCSCTICGGETITCRSFGICTLRIDLRASSGREKRRLGIAVGDLSIVFDLDSRDMVVVNDDRNRNRVSSPRTRDPFDGCRRVGTRDAVAVRVRAKAHRGVKHLGRFQKCRDGVAIAECWKLTHPLCVYVVVCGSEE